MRPDPASLPGADETPASNARAARVGVAYGVAAYLWWGLCPIYFKAIASVPALQILGHRIVWSVVLLVLLTLVQRRWAPVWTVCRDRRTLLRLCVTTALIANNWGLFIWAVTHDQLLQASFGYFINPLVNVLLGFVFLRERLRRMQTVAVLLAVAGVAYLIIGYGQVPWLALVLAFSFGFYGFLRKTTRADALVGLTVETALLTPIALAYLVYQGLRGDGAFGMVSREMDLLLVSAGVVTAVPLLWFAAAAKRLWYSTLGILQYLAPTGQFLLAVLAYGEPFTREHLISFSLIWAALIIYTADTVLLPRRSVSSLPSKHG
jgi:chloramphenicol-sensitive protein RarD